MIDSLIVGVVGCSRRQDSACRQQRRSSQLTLPTFIQGLANLSFQNPLRTAQGNVRAEQDLATQRCVMLSLATFCPRETRKRGGLPQTPARPIGADSRQPKDAHEYYYFRCMSHKLAI